MQSQIREFRTIGPFSSAGGLRAVTFDPLNTSSALTLSNGNLTATNNQLGDTGDWGTTRSTTFKSTGKYYWELLCNGASGQANYEVGICNASMNVNAVLGGDLHSGGYNGGSTLGFFINNSGTGTSVTFGPPQIVGLAADFGAQLIWMRNLTNSQSIWNAGGSANPATGTGGYSFSSITGPYFAAVSLRDDGSGSDGFTVNFGYAQAFAGGVPAGFGNW